MMLLVGGGALDLIFHLPKRGLGFSAEKTEPESAIAATAASPAVSVRLWK
jgi:hypothetical protein